MPDPRSNAPLPAKVRFIAYHRPALKEGLYYIDVSPALSTAGTPRISGATQRKHFQVSGSRFQLKPQEVHSVFPPAGSLGDHENVLPHIILRRSTLPWERGAGGSNDSIPWLALLVFDGSEETPEAKVISIKKLKEEATAYHFPGVTDEVGQQDTDKVTVIDVKKKVLDKILPQKAGLPYLAHVRQGFDAHGQMTGGEFALVVANRLPLKEGISQVHLVSLEDRYAGTDFDYQGATDPEDAVRLVSLYSWQFACINPNQSLPRLLERLNTGSHSSDEHNLRLPAVNNPLADSLLATGNVPLKHLMRNGSSSISWYHGPLATGVNPNHADALPVMASDALLRFDQDTGMFDVSYAAAWELGRMLILQNKAIAVSLYNWKRSHAQKNKLAELQLTHRHLPAQWPITETEAQEAVPQKVSDWFYSLSLLKGVPFNYLVPDNRLLPVESLRFFLVDKEWIECLLDGAFSIGRVISDDQKQDHGHHHDEDSTNPAQNPFQFLSGLIMRSEAVSGYPGLQIDAYQAQNSIALSQPSVDVLRNAASTDSQLLAALKTDFQSDQLSIVTEILQEQWLVHVLDKDEQYAIRKNGDSYQVWLKNKLVRREKLSANVLLCLFEGGIEEVDMYQKPESLHFGLDRRLSGDNITYYKQLKNRQGGALENADIDFNADLYNDRSRTLNISTLATTIQSRLSWPAIDSALFAIEMTEGVERIRFRK